MQRQKRGQDAALHHITFKRCGNAALFLYGGERMEINDILTAISTVGFPIVACIALYYQNLKMSSAITSMTTAITELKTYIENINKRGCDDGK